MATLHYVGIAEPTETGWSISFPSFPGTITVDETFHGLMKQARDALSSIVTAMQEDGEALPPDVDQDKGGMGCDLSQYRDPRSVMIPVDVEGASVRVNISMDDGLLARLDSLSKRQDISRSALLARGARMVLAAEAGG